MEPKNEKREVKKEEVVFSPEEQQIRIQIERELMRRSSVKDNQEWVDRYGKAYADLFNNEENKASFLKMFQEEPEALYALLRQVLGEDRE